ncbi:MAG: SpoIIE family protein phosphatase [Microscillaceae bacterium]|nr:SpoIIE family protein phosphatase [Microscillaceae bacterium]MDW8460460.1 SpoIIE family protein phosphatase [Cytophagales bacterium]
MTFSFHKIGKYFRDIPLRHKIGIPVLCALVIVAFNQIFNIYFINNSYKNTERWLITLSEARVQSQKALYLLHTLVYNENNLARAEIETINQQIEYTISIAEKGGNLKINNQNIELAPIYTTELASEIKDWAEIWKNFREITTQIITENVSIETSPDTLQNLIMVERKQNAVVKDALNQAVIYHEQLIQKINDLQKNLIKIGQDYRKFLTSIEGSLLLIVLAILLFILYVVITYISQNVKKITQATTEIAAGNINSVQLKITNQDELGQIADSINQLAQNIQIASNFTQKIGEGDYEALLVEDEVQAVTLSQNILFASLKQMQQKLKTLAEEDTKRNWITEGLAKFSEIIRNNNQSFEQLGDAVLAYIVNYIRANQGYFFILNEENNQQPCLDLVSSYAFGRKKFLHKQIPIYEHYAEGLVGQAYMEKESILLKEIPEDYVQIKSGLGGANPTHILIAPFKINQKVEGVIEIASFNEIGKYEIELVERICEGVASAVLAIKINQRTQKLLAETQKLANALKEQEQELRQNNEELIATQEEMKRKNLEIEARIAAIDNSGIASIEMTMEGIILTANKSFLDLFQYSAEEIIGKNYKMLVDREYANSKEYTQFWQDLNLGIAKTGEVKRKRKDGQYIYLAAAYSVIKDTRGNNVRILKLATDITETKKLLAESQRQAEILRIQEETLRANMIALQETQEELKRTSEAIIKLKEEEARYAQEKAREIENKNQLITASIKYAQNIQRAILPPKEIIEKFVEECFIIYLPKDIVSGDFYWYNQVSENKAFFAAVDCTGHGVPGAFMSIIGNTLLNEIVSTNKDISPAQILEQLHIGIYTKLRQEESSNHDGMDVCLCCLEKINKQEVKLTFSGAKRSLYYISQDNLYELKGDRISIGGWHVENRRSFQNQERIIRKNDLLFLCTDGIIDNPNPNRKKFGEKRFENLLLEIAHLPMEIQKEKILQEVKLHQQDAEQRDDLTLLGLKI